MTLLLVVYFLIGAALMVVNFSIHRMQHPGCHEVQAWRVLLGMVIWPGILVNNAIFRLPSAWRELKKGQG
jgi:hypothetical protein